MGGFGRTLAERFENYPHTQTMLSLMRDGFHPESQGGTWVLAKKMRVIKELT